VRRAERDVTVTRRGELIECFEVRAAQPHDLSPVDSALAGKREQARLGIAPPGEREPIRYSVLIEQHAAL
jgi:hypothetical protein